MEYNNTENTDINKADFCTYCGKELDNDVNFCPCCGTPISHNSEEKKDEKAIRLSKKKRLSFIRWASIVIIAVSIISVIISIVLGIRKNNANYNLTGNLEMRDKDGDVLITIEDVDSAEIETITDENGNKEYSILLHFTDEGTKKFSDVTSRLAEKQEQLYIYINNQCVDTPTVYSVITDGKAYITRSNLYEDAELILARLYGTDISEDIESFDEITETENILNIMDYHYAIKQVYYYGGEEDYIPDNEQFWVRAEYTFDNGNSSIEYILTDTSAHIYNILDYYSINMDYNLSIIVSLPNGRIAFGYTKYAGEYAYGSNSRDYKIIDSADPELNDISNQFFDEGEIIWSIRNDENGISIFTYQTLETYSYQDIIINVYDECMNKKFSFSKSELFNKYNCDDFYMSVDTLNLTPIGGNVYYMRTSDDYDDILFIDTTRNKVFVIEDVGFSKGCTSDGDYVICARKTHVGDFGLIIDIDSESLIFENMKGYFSEIKEGRFFWRDTYNSIICNLCDYKGNVLANLDKDGKLSNYSSFYNGHAVLELVNPGGTTFVTIIDNQGNWLFEPISGNLGGVKTPYYFENIDCFLIFSNDGSGGYLLNAQGMQQQLPSILSRSGWFYHLTNINGESRIIYLDYQQEMFLYTDEVISVNEYISANNSPNKKNSIIEEKKLVASSGGYYQCVNDFPLEVDDTIWEMSEKEFEQYTGIFFPKKEAEYERYYLMNLPELKGDYYIIESADSCVVFDKEKGLIGIQLEIWLEDNSDENMANNLKDWLNNNEEFITYDEQNFIWVKDNHFTILHAFHGEFDENPTTLLYFNKAYINTASDAELQKRLGGMADILINIKN